MRAPRFLLLAVTAGLAIPASAQLLGGGGPVGGITGAVGGLTQGVLGGPGQPISPVIGGLQGPLAGLGDTVRSLAPSDLLALRRQRLQALVRENRRTLDMDDAGNPVRRDEILALD